MGCVPALGGGCATLGFGICMSGDVFLTGRMAQGICTRDPREKLLGLGLLLSP